MKKRTMLPAIAAIATSLTATLSSQAATEGWSHDFAAAAEQASKEKKALLIDFTGSDWCHWCIKLNEEVFQKEAFKTAVTKNFVPLELDFPKDKSLIDEKTREQNTKLQEKYQVQGFPTILLTDAEGRPFARTGYKEGGPEAYLKSLDTLLESKTKRDAKFAEAEKAEGLEKAKFLYDGLQVVPEEYRRLYPKVIEMIIDLDTEDSLGLRADQELHKAMMTLEEDLQAAMAQGDTVTALKHIDEFVAKHPKTPERKQEALTVKINVLMEAGEFEKVAKVADEIVAVAPDTDLAANVKNFAETQLKAMIEEKKKNEVTEPEPTPKKEPAAKAEETKSE